MEGWLGVPLLVVVGLHLYPFLLCLFSRLSDTLPYLLSREGPLMLFGLAVVTHLIYVLCFVPLLITLGWASWSSPQWGVVVVEVVIVLVVMWRVKTKVDPVPANLQSLDGTAPSQSSLLHLGV